MTTTTYVNEAGAQKIRDFKYKGSDQSICYHYFVSPLCNYLVNNWVPEWIAPNLITAIGSIFAIIAHIMVWVMLGNRLGGEYPAWLPASCAVLTAGYFIFDNIDGKQARKTGNSSALGLLFDHGVDALMPTLLGLNVIAIAQGENEIKSILGFSAATLAFLLPTWEEYLLGVLDLPMINGAIEGVILIISVLGFSAFVGAGWWNAEMFGIPKSTCFGYMLAGLFMPTLILSISKVIVKLDKKKHGYALSKMKTSFMLVASMVLVNYLSPTNIISRIPRQVMYVAGISHAKLCTHIQLTHVMEQKMNENIFSIWVPQILQLANIIFGLVTGKPLVDEDMLVWALLAYVVIDYSIYVYKVVNEVADALGIKVFKIPYKPKKIQ